MAAFQLNQSAPEFFEALRPHERIGVPPKDQGRLAKLLSEH
jgi:hypothetical protein